MKKIVEFCEVCNEDTLHRHKRVCWKQKKKGGAGYYSAMLPIRCFKCGIEAGKRPVKEGKKRKHITFR